MGTLPATFSPISMGKMGHAYNNVAAGSQSVSVGDSATLKLNAQIGRTPHTLTTAISSVFGGRTTPFTYV